MNKPTKKELYNTVKQLENQIKLQREMYEKLLKEFGIKFKKNIVVSSGRFGCHTVQAVYILGDKEMYSAFHVDDKFLHLYEE